MNKFNRYFMITLAVVGMMTATSAKTKKKIEKPDAVYAFGFAASFNDSTVYFTDIQQIDKATLEKRTQFLPNRNEYTTQLREYLATKGKSNQTCVISYAKNRKDIEKKFANFRKKYLKGGHYDLKYITTTDFQFHYVEPSESVSKEVSVPKIDESKKNKGPRPLKEQMKRPRPGKGGMPPMQ